MPYIRERKIKVLVAVLVIDFRINIQLTGSNVHLIDIGCWLSYLYQYNCRKCEENNIRVSSSFGWFLDLQNGETDRVVIFTADRAPELIRHVMKTCPIESKLFSGIPLCILQRLFWAFPTISLSSFSIRKNYEQFFVKTL